jgi:hypothetical protein
MYRGSFWWLRDRSVNLATYFHPVMWLRMGEAVPLLPTCTFVAFLFSSFRIKTLSSYFTHTHTHPHTHTHTHTHKRTHCRKGSNSHISLIYGTRHNMSSMLNYTQLQEYDSYKLTDSHSLQTAAMWKKILVFCEFIKNERTADFLDRIINTDVNFRIFIWRCFNTVFFSGGGRSSPPVNLRLLIHEVSRSHTTTYHSR